MNVPHPIPGYTYLGAFLGVLADGSTSSAVYSFYQRDTDKKQFYGTQGDAPWIIKLSDVNELTWFNGFVPFRP